MKQIKEAFDLKFVIQLAVYAAIMGVAWGGLTGKVQAVSAAGNADHSDLTEIKIVKIPALEREVMANRGHRLDEMPLEEKLKIFVSKELYVQSQDGLKKDIRDLTIAVRGLQEDVKELIKTRAES